MKTHIYLFVLLSFVLFNCTPDHIPPLLGNIEGNLALYTEDNELMDDPSGVKVRLEGIDPAREVLTDTRGDWAFKDVPSGTYNIFMSKDGYATHKLFSVTHAGGNVATVPTMYVLPIFKLTTSVITGASIETLPGYIGASATGDPEKFTIAFIGRSGSNSPQNYLYYYHRRIEYSSYLFTYAEYKAWGFKSGDEVSIKFYGTASIGEGYFDPTVDKFIIENISQDFKEVKFKLP